MEYINKSMIKTLIAAIFGILVTFPSMGQDSQIASRCYFNGEGLGTCYVKNLSEEAKEVTLKLTVESVNTFQNISAFEGATEDVYIGFLQPREFNVSRFTSELLADCVSNSMEQGKILTETNWHQVCSIRISGVISR